MLALSGGAAAQDYPNRTVKIIVPFPAGGTADAMPRIVAEFLARKWGQAVIIENRAGAGGNTGADAAYQVRSGRLHAVRRRRRRRWSSTRISIAKLPFDPAAVHSARGDGQGAERDPDQLAEAEGREDRRRVRRLCQGAIRASSTPATQGIGTTAHLTSELFAQMAGVKFQHIHYRGSAPAVQDLVAGNVDVAFDNVGAAGR